MRVDFRRVVSILLWVVMSAGSSLAISIGGTVTDDGETGIPDVEVRVLETGGAHFTLTTTDAFGVYVADGLIAGDYVLWTRNEDGFVDELFDDIPCAGGCNFFTGTPVTVGPGADATGIDFELCDGGRISGVVTDGVGGALESVDVEIFDSEGDLVTTGLSDATGMYLSPTGLPTGDYFARTRNSQGLFDELWDDIGCPGDCDPTEGTVIGVTEGVVIPDIDFALIPGGDARSIWGFRHRGDPGRYLLPDGRQLGRLAGGRGLR